MVACFGLGFVRFRRSCRWCGPEGPRINLALALFLLVFCCFVLVPFCFLGGGFCLAVGPTRQHQQRKGAQAKTEENLVFSSWVWGTIGRESFGNRKNKRKNHKHNFLLKYIIVFLYFSLVILLIFSSFSSFLFFSFLAFFCCFDSIQLGQINKRKQQEIRDKRQSKRNKKEEEQKTNKTKTTKKRKANRNVDLKKCNLQNLEKGLRCAEWRVAQILNLNSADLKPKPSQNAKPQKHLSAERSVLKNKITPRRCRS